MMGTRYAQGARGFAGCRGMHFAMEARMSPGLALMKLSTTTEQQFSTRVPQEFL